MVDKHERTLVRCAIAHAMRAGHKKDFGKITLQKLTNIVTTPPKKHSVAYR